MDSINEWDKQAKFYNDKFGDGTDMYTELIIPTIRNMAPVKHGDRVLDLGTGSALIAVEFARKGATVTANDGSVRMLDAAKERVDKHPDLAGKITLGVLNLVDADALDQFAAQHPKEFDVINISMTLKHLPDLSPLANVLPKLLSPGGRVVVVDLHPAFAKPAGHRMMEIYEDDKTGKQEIHHFIKIRRYLEIHTVKSEALRGQSDPFDLYHRPLEALLGTFFSKGFVLEGLRELGFSGDRDPQQIQSYHNFQQFPMLLAFNMRWLGTRAD